MSTTDSVFFVASANQNEKALLSFLIPNGTTKKRPSKCDLCIYESHEEPYDFFVQGFDDFNDFNPAVKAFLPQTPPLITSWDHIVELAEFLSGVVPVRVGYNEWEQSPLPEEQWFVVGPKLGALFVDSVCRGTLDENGDSLPTCEDCGQQKIRWSSARKNLSKYRLLRNEWTGTDVFLLEGGGQHRGVCMTGAAVQKIRNYGFMNLDLIELDWA